MTTILKRKSSEDLKTAIALLEQKRDTERAAISEQFSIVADSLKPVNLLKRSIQEITGSIDLKDQFIHKGAGLLAGYLTRKLVVRSSTNPFVRLAAVALQYGVTNYISDNSGTFANKVLTLFNRLTDKPPKQ
ncbi:MAG: hypothetical protein WCP85_13355 [Mariniphaga sp.]